MFFKMCVVIFLGQFSRRDALLRLQYGDKQTTEGDQPKTDFESMPRFVVGNCGL